MERKKVTIYFNFIADESPIEMGIGYKVGLCNNHLRCE